MFSIIPVYELEHSFKEVKKEAASLDRWVFFFSRRSGDEFPKMLNQFVQDIHVHQTKKNKERGRN